MYGGDRSRRTPPADTGCRVAPAPDNRPLTLAEWERKVQQVVYVSATPGPYEEQRSQQTIEVIIRPTGLVDPTLEVRPTKGQIDDLLGEIKKRVDKKQRTLITVLTKKMAEDMTDYLREMGIKVNYLHSDVDTLERVEILRDLRLGVFDVLVGINLLREGLDLPEVALIAILDADKESYMRDARSLIQTTGRAARNVEGHVIMYADSVSGSMQRAIDETDRRRNIQIAYNEEHGITPAPIVKAAYNLKDIDLTIPRDKLVVFTGLSGSGKSSLAFDTIYAEGQRRYVESLSSYARQFLGQMDKPDVDQIDGLSPAISIDQKGASHNPRSTVGTVTEIYDYMRLMWARIGHPHCPISGHEITRQTTEQIADRILEMPKGSRIRIMAPIVRGRKGEFQDVFAEARKAGFSRVRVDGNFYELNEKITLEKNKKHDIEIDVDRLPVEPTAISRMRESVEN